MIPPAPFGNAATTRWKPRLPERHSVTVPLADYDEAMAKAASFGWRLVGRHTTTYGDGDGPPRPPTFTLEFVR